eukprot:5019151-Amphidinium_carterae.1
MSNHKPPLPKCPITVSVCVFSVREHHTVQAAAPWSNPYLRHANFVHNHTPSLSESGKGWPTALASLVQSCAPIAGGCSSGGCAANCPTNCKP